MRCSCIDCGAYMAQSEDSHLGCVCPECGKRCTACLGTNSLMSRDAVARLKTDPVLAEAMLRRISVSGANDERE
ncbi:MAG: hypothetical protein IKS90_01010 [Clostridia bacterium]|nr:hypothetical protein [Clostridia bacterium]